MAKLSTAEIIDAIKELSVLELNDLVKACEEEFGVSAAAGVVVAAAGDAGAAGAAEEKDSFDVELTDDKFEELYQVWFSNNSELNSWDTDWQGHDKLFERLNVTAYHALNDMLKKNEPDFADPLDAYWEISEETEDIF